MDIRFRHNILLVKDINLSKYFYADVIGLKICKEFETFIQFEDHFAIHSADLFYEYINKPYFEQKMGHDNIDLYFTTSNLPEVSKKLKIAKVEFIHDIRHCEWGENIIRVYDPDGHIIEIGDAHNMMQD